MPLHRILTGIGIYPGLDRHGIWAVVLMLVASLIGGMLPIQARAASPAAAAAAPQTQQASVVLIVASSQYGLPVPEATTKNAVSALKAQGISPGNIYVEHLDLRRFGDAATAASSLATLLRQKYANKHIGLVLAQEQPALDFLAQAGNDLLPPGLPVLATFVTTPTLQWRGSPHPVLNISNRYDVAGTLRYGLDLFPQARRLVLVAGVGRTQAALPSELAEVLAAQRRQLEIEDTSTLPYEAMLQRIASLPPNTLIFLADYFQDSTGRPFVPAEVAAEIAKRANAPTLGLYDTHIQAGLTGGLVIVPSEVGRRAGEIGARLLVLRHR